MAQPTPTTRPLEHPIPPNPRAPEPLERIPPHDIEAEMALLGSMMLDREKIPDVLNVITREEANRFYRLDHRTIFDAVLHLYDQGQPLDLVIVRDELRRRGELDRVGGEDYLVQIAESVPHTENAEYYARVVRNKSLLRDLISCAGKIMRDAYTEHEDTVSVLDTAERRLFAVAEQRITARPELLQSQLDDIWQEIETRDGQFVSGLATGFLELDSLTSGFQNGELIVLAARPSVGKTALALGMALHMAGRENKRVGFFSMEMGKRQIALRSMCCWGRVNSHKLRHGMLNSDEIGRLQDACDTLKQVSMFIDDTPGMTVFDLRAKARRLRLQHRIDAVFIDYLQLMDNPKSDNRQAEIAFISRGLKALARELNIPVIACAQLNRQPEGRTDFRPRMSDLRESGAIEQDSDVVILLHRPEVHDAKIVEKEPNLRGYTELIVAKQRNGPIGKIKLQFHHEWTRFNPAAPEAAHMGYAEPAQAGLEPAPEPFESETPF